MVEKMVEKNNEQITSKTEYLNKIDDELNGMQQSVRDTLSMLQNTEFSKASNVKKFVMENSTETMDKVLS